MGEILILKSGKEIIRTERSNVADIHHTPEGVTFILRDGFIISYSDAYMPSYTKDIIRNTFNSMTTANLEINLSDYNRPVKAKL